MKLDRNKIKETVKNDVVTCYDNEQLSLFNIGVHHNTEGEIRYAAGELVEKVLNTIFQSINKFLDDNIVSKVGSTDYLKKEILYKNVKYINNHIQVDRHVWYKGKRLAFIENKTYLDTCYYDRALADFKKIAQSLVQNSYNPKECLFIVFAGQKAGKENTFLTYEAEFWYETKSLMGTNEGIEPKTIYFLKGTRNSSKPLYKIKHELNFDNIYKFVDLILDKVESM